jgi:hypothetical protein
MSQSLGRKEIIEILVHWKFPPIALATLSNQPQPKGRATVDRALRQGERNRYRSGLESLNSAELQSIYERETIAALTDMQREEDARFFNQPPAKADFDHWSKAEHWSLDEAVALVFGKAPEIVSWDKIKAHGASSFVKQYARLRDLADRARVWEKLYDPVLPVIFFKWAGDNEIAIPAELAEKVAKLKGKLTDWEKYYEETKVAYDGLLSRYEEYRGMYGQHIGDWKVLVKKKTDLIEAAHLRITGLEGELAKARVNIVSSNPRPAKAPRDLLKDCEQQAG